MTNDHVITPAVPDGRIEVLLASGERLPAGRWSTAEGGWSK
ncbi:hypothetical protein [Promicromonospora panici]|nr:hypothetical protein [Promicromonospora panici]